MKKVSVFFLLCDCLKVYHQIFSPGFYCLSGSNTSTPHSTFYNPNTNLSYIGNICPKGYYCEEGSITPQPCPAGTFNSEYGSDSLSDCSSCTPGYYCEGTGNPAPTGKCLDGYYCVGGSYTSTQHMAEPGYFAVSGASNQTACSPGTYNMDHRQTSCLDCPEGFYCPTSALTIYADYLCTMGHYCPRGSINPSKCPSGTFSNITGNVNITQCTDCTPGYYCQYDGLTEVTGPCNAGYYCVIGASSRIQPATTSTGGQCFTGHYCLSGSGYPTPCPRGSYMSSRMNEGSHYYDGVNYYCQLCPSGKACDGIGLSNYTGPVSAGYWSIQGAPTDTPVCTSSECQTYYGICPKGSYCPTNSTVPTMCPAGTYQDSKGQASCIVSHYMIFNHTCNAIQ